VIDGEGSFRKGSLIAALIGGLGSVALMLMSGLRPPVFIIILFIAWVLSPFVVLSVGVILASRWSTKTRGTLYWLTRLITVSSLAIYIYVLVKPLQSQPAFPYVAVPIGSGVIILAILAVTALISRRNNGE
jgi:hypothetical protein